MTDLKKLYQLPWSETDNPNGWIEPTTFCNLKCPGCYRGCDKPDHSPVHIELDALKAQIDWFIQHRNIQTLSIAGGEPLLYPHLEELISYASSFSLKVMLYSNGIGLNQEKLEKLKLAGTTQVLIHVDEFQQRTKTDSVDEIIALKNDYCQLFRKIGGIGLGFIQPLTDNGLKNSEKMNRFFSLNRDVIALVVYTLYREVCWTQDEHPEIDTSLKINDVVEALKQQGVFYPSTYLKSTINDQEPSWVFSYSIGSSDRINGFVSHQGGSFIQKRYRSNKGRHLFISRHHKVSRWSLLKLSFIPGFISIYLKSLFTQGELYFQTYLLLRGPEKRSNTWDLCVGCPDAILHNGKLVPSCILEDIKQQSRNPENSEIVNY